MLSYITYKVCVFICRRFLHGNKVENKVKHEAEMVLKKVRSRWYILQTTLHVQTQVSCNASPPSPPSFFSASFKPVSPSPPHIVNSVLVKNLVLIQTSQLCCLCQCLFPPPSMCYECALRACTYLCVCVWRRRKPVSVERHCPAMCSLSECILKRPSWGGCVHSADLDYLFFLFYVTFPKISFIKCT